MRRPDGSLILQPRDLERRKQFDAESKRRLDFAALACVHKWGEGKLALWGDPDERYWKSELIDNSVSPFFRQSPFVSMNFSPENSGVLFFSQPLLRPPLLMCWWRLSYTFPEPAPGPPPDPRVLREKAIRDIIAAGKVPTEQGYGYKKFVPEVRFRCGVPEGAKVRGFDRKTLGDIYKKLKSPGK